MRAETVDRRYDDASFHAGFPPPSESLADCTERLLPVVDEELRPAMEEAVHRAVVLEKEAGFEYEVPTVVVVASENVLRGLVMHLEGLSETEVPLIDVPYAVPLVYQLDSSLAPIETPWAERPLKAGWYLGDPAKVRAVQAEIQADLPDDGREESCLVPLTNDEKASWEC